MKKHNPNNEINPGIIKADIVAASQAVAYFKEHKVKDIKNIAAYHIQQAAEKLIKIQIYDSAETIENSRIFTHNIEALLAYAEERGIEISVPDYIRENALTITRWEAGSRYGLGLSIRIDTLEKCLNIVSEWCDRIA